MIIYDVEVTYTSRFQFRKVILTAIMVFHKLKLSVEATSLAVFTAKMNGWRRTASTSTTTTARATSCSRSSRNCRGAAASSPLLIRSGSRLNLE